MNSSRRRAAHWSWLDTPWPWARKITWRDSGSSCARIAAPARRRQPVVAAAQQQGRDRRRHRLALGRRRHRHAPHRAEGRQLAELRGQAVDAARLDRPLARRLVDAGPGLAAFDGVEQAAELLRVGLEQAAIVLLEILGELLDQPLVAALQRGHRLGHQRRLALPHHVQQHQQQLGAVELHRLRSVLQRQGQLRAACDRLASSTALTLAARSGLRSRQSLSEAHSP